MIITETKIPDVVEDNIDDSKKILAENIIRNVYPLFDDIYNERVHSTEEVKLKIKAKKEELKNKKEAIELLIGEYNRKKKITKLLNRVEQLVQSGLLYDGTLKHEMVIMLKIIEKLPPDKLDQQLAKTMHIISKRYSQ